MKVCEICYKCFSNGKALGGHMRSHMVKLALPRPSRSKSRSKSRSRSASSESETESDDSSYKGKKKGKVRSKRGDHDDYILSVQDAAMLLVSLSKERWCRGEEKVSTSKSNSVIKSVFKCGTCRKEFSSYQALGGHKANHKKIKKYNHMDDEFENDQDKYGEDEDVVEEEDEENSTTVEEESKMKKVFHCSLCPRVFNSGQALGGHKKVHYSNNLDSTTSRKIKLMIDLNQFPLEVE
ncbi:hypothetical protein CsatA_018025 [Cannabis sativa]